MCFGIFKRCLESEESAGPAPKPHAGSSVATSEVPPQVNMETKPKSEQQSTYEITQAAIDHYLKGKKDDGEIHGVGWWQVANGYTAIALHDHYTHTIRNLPPIRKQLDRCHKHRYAHFINEYNDDTLWFGHALLDLYTASLSPTTSDRWLLDNARGTWEHTARYQLPDGKHFIEDGKADMGGAVHWTSKEGDDAANTITTSLFVEMACRLALEVSATGEDPERKAAHGYLVAAERGISWILREVYRREDDIILDGIDMNKDFRNQWTFTYTTGQTIAALVLFARALRLIPSFGKSTQAAEYMQTACVLANASYRRNQWTNDAGVLVENRRGQKDPEKGDDGWVFGSVLVRSVAKLYCALRDEGWRGQGEVFERAERGAREFVMVQFESNRRSNCSEGKVYGPWWEGPFEFPTAHSQLAVLDVMAAVHAVSD